MHVPDGFLDVPTSLATGAIAVGAVGLALRRSEAELRASGPALPGLLAAFIFATQMVNFPVGAGTSGHLIGGTLAAVLVGPWTAVLVMTVVLIVQALLFADGGLSALGTNVTLLAIVAVLVGWLTTRALLRLLPRRATSVVPAATLGAFLSVPAAAGVFTLLYAAGGTIDISLTALAGAMIGWHAVIGIGEAAITAAIVGAVVATRPDLIYAVRDARSELVLVEADGTRSTVPAEQAAAEVTRPRGARGVLAVGGLITLIVAGGLSLLASAHPDGLEFVGEQLGFAEAGQASAAEVSPFAEYGLSGVPELFGTSIAGLVGALATLAVALLLAWLVAGQRRRSAEAGTRPAGDQVRAGRGA